MQPNPTEPRRLAADMLHHALSTRTAPEFIAPSLFGAEALSESDLRFARRMVLTAMRHLGQIDAVLARYIERPLPPAKAWVVCALRIGVAQMRFDDVPAHAAVHATVEAVKRSKFSALSGMVNAVLKKTASDNVRDDAITNLPAWLRTRLEAHYGEAHVARMAAVAARQPAYDVYGAPQDITGATRLSAHTQRVATYEAMIDAIHHQSPAFVQDIAASYPVAMLGDVVGKRVIEIGAAPGGKTMQLLLAGAQVAAIDRSAPRMERLKENLAARGLQAECVVEDAMRYTPAAAPDIVVLDAPCSATGTWRKHPEVMHLLEEKTIAELAPIQAKLLQHAWGWLAKGGQLLYIVCSLQEEEGEEQLAQFLAAHNDARIVAPAAGAVPEGALRADGSMRTHLALMEDVGGMDGFFAVVLEKA